MCITPTWPSLTLLLCLISEPEEDASPGWDVIYSTLKLVPGGFAAAACTVSNRKNISKPIKPRRRTYLREFWKFLQTIFNTNMFYYNIVYVMVHHSLVQYICLNNIYCTSELWFCCIISVTGTKLQIFNAWLTLNSDFFHFSN